MGRKAKLRIFLESEIYGREYFRCDADAQKVLDQLLRDSEHEFAKDGVTRRIGIEVTTGTNGYDPDAARIPVELLRPGTR